MALMTRLPGEDRYTWDRPPQSTASAQALGATLARYHQAVWGWSPGALSAGAVERDVLRRLAVTLAHEAEARATLKALVPYLSRLDRRAWPALIVHGDYHAANVRWTGPKEKSRICGIFDFEYAELNWRLYDVGMAAACQATCWGDGPNGAGGVGRLARPLLDAFITGYSGAIGADADLPPLLAEEIDALPRYLELAQLLTLEWALAPGTARRLGTATAERYARHARSALDWLRRKASSI
jgi:Ser/Thr protein kinase RdoA (MazF antagonist)